MAVLMLMVREHSSTFLWGGGSPCMHVHAGLIWGHVILFAGHIPVTCISHPLRFTSCFVITPYDDDLRSIPSDLSTERIRTRATILDRAIANSTCSLASPIKTRKLENLWKNKLVCQQIFAIPMHTKRPFVKPVCLDKTDVSFLLFQCIYSGADHLDFQLQLSFPHYLRIYGDVCVCRQCRCRHLDYHYLILPAVIPIP